MAPRRVQGAFNISLHMRTYPMTMQCITYLPCSSRDLTVSILRRPLPTLDLTTGYDGAVRVPFVCWAMKKTPRINISAGLEAEDILH